ncbi:hypothetical protein A1Q1_04662 [Trichosporon asahii var. asahii CBS 2479]|uniref:Serine protease n=1 Tax=Trichosporon asahii var. asahii (strain ATCC 90039 / CBS 2479 / JCM 2466 / KCTC 7840 / NBRC 103889/ NCYC 2677 / UAMH 7654) TaxID=1186058 RepID=J6EV76_TRIAS|nr:hypothetical protein A1Q1_04662 [Trichosporon asahii var. asahii CBS 2479]EJT46697.1 hypothetical protein A1Q1_04662 [Trichosporon asahii var. asahii CBS 2479]
MLANTLLPLLAAAATAQAAPPAVPPVPDTVQTYKHLDNNGSGVSGYNVTSSWSYNYTWSSDGKGPVKTETSGGSNVDVQTIGELTKNLTEQLKSTVDGALKEIAEDVRKLQQQFFHDIEKLPKLFDSNAELGKSLLDNGYLSVYQHMADDGELNPEGYSYINTLDEQPADTPAEEEDPVKGPFCFDQKISHFDNSQQGTFCQRYWISTKEWKAGGAVILHDAGESEASGSTYYMKKGLLHHLMAATHGLGIVLEHRYYGKSTPLDSFSTDNMRFLNLKESLEDSANFIRNFKLPEGVTVEGANADTFKPNNVPWIYQGCSYPGAKAAFMRQQYPDLVFGAVAGSAVTQAIDEFPQYYDAFQKYYYNQDCVKGIQGAIKVIDEWLDDEKKAPAMKSLFGAATLKNDDFAYFLRWPLQFQKRSVPLGKASIPDAFCRTLQEDTKPIQVAGAEVPGAVVNFANATRVWIRNTGSCGRNESTLAACYDTSDGSPAAEKRKSDTLRDTWRPWIWQQCTEFGYFFGPAKEGGVLSKYLTYDVHHRVCRQSFPAGSKYQIPERPDTEKVNCHGGREINVERVLFTAGEQDPWRPAMPNAEGVNRPNTTSQAQYLMPGGGHCWDSQGYDAIDSGGGKDGNEPEPDLTRNTHNFQMGIVKAWLNDWKKPGRRSIEKRQRIRVL